VVMMGDDVDFSTRALASSAIITTMGD
jgi:hypothetical protein